MNAGKGKNIKVRNLFDDISNKYKTNTKTIDCFLLIISTLFLKSQTKTEHNLQISTSFNPRVTPFHN